MIRHPVPAIVFGLILLFAVAIACQPAAVSADDGVGVPSPTATTTSTPSPTPTAMPVPTGSITITVNAPFCSPIVSQCPQFGFVVANGALPSFNLPEQRGSYTHVYNNVTPGFYAISETFAGLPLASIYCSSDRGFNQQQASAQGVSIGIPIRGNEHATCTLTNALPTPLPTQALSLVVTATPTLSVPLSIPTQPPAAPVVNNYFAAPVPTLVPAVPASAQPVAPAPAPGVRFSAPATGDSGILVFFGPCMID